MPVTRSSSIISVRSSTLSRKSTPKPSSEIISLSDDDPLLPKRHSKRHPRAKSKVQAKPAQVSEVLEISSDDSKSPVPRRSPVKSPASLNAIRNLRNQIFYLERKNTKLQQEHRSLKAKSKADMDALEDHISCDICVLHLWSPYILPECGHSFCKSCLEQWFDKILTQHLRAHPFYDVDANVIDDHPDNHPADAEHPALLARIYDNAFGVGIPQQQQQPQPRPQYTCPSCRAEVKSRPVEEFTLKAVVRTIAASAGESSSVGSGSWETRYNSPWDRFFGKKPI